MDPFTGVGGPQPPSLGAGWDLWPLAGLVTGLLVGRRLLGLRWGAALAVFTMGVTLAIPLGVDIWGVVPVFAGLLVPTMLYRLAVPGAPPEPPDGV